METRHPILIFVAVFMGLWLASLVGSWLHRRNPSAGDEQHEDLGILVGATLTLLALMIGFSVSLCPAAAGGHASGRVRNYIPDVVLLSLFGIAAVACGFAGYASGLDPLRTRLPVFITAFLVCSVIFVILDLDRPNVGFITINQQPMIDTVASLSAFNE